MVLEAVLVKKLCSHVTVKKIFQKRIKNISMARENVSFTRYYCKVLIGGGGGVGGGGIDVYTKKHGRTNSGSVGQDALPGPLHLLVQIVAIPPKILK